MNHLFAFYISLTFILISLSVSFYLLNYVHKHHIKDYFSRGITYFKMCLQNILCIPQAFAGLSHED